MDVLEQSSLLVAITSFAIGSSVLARNVKNKLFLAFASLTALISGWALFFFLAKLWDSPAFYKVHLLLNLWLAPMGLAFIRVMVRIQDRLSRSLVGISVLMAAGLTFCLAVGLETNPWVLPFIYFLPAMVVLQILQLIWNDVRLRRGIRLPTKAPTVGLHQRNLIYLGGLLVLLTCTMDHSPLLGHVVPSLGNLALTVYLFFLSQAIAQQRLLNFGALFSRFLVLLAIALMLTLVYSLLFAWIENRPALFFLNSFIVSFVLLTMLEPIRSMVGYFTRRLLTQKYLRLEETLREAQRKLALITDPISLFQAIVLTTEMTLQPEAGALYVLQGDETQFRRMRVFGNADDRIGRAPRELLVSHPMLEHCRSLQKKGELPILLDQVLESESDRSASRKQREHLAGLIEGLRAMHGNLLIPLFDGNRVLAFVILNAPSPPQAWGSNWGLLRIIHPYYEQAAASMRSLEVFVRQREKERLAALGEMAAGLAHEIRNPLGAIKGAAQFLEPSSSDERPESRFLRIILEETDRLNHVVTQFLDYSKPAQAAELKLTSLNLLAERTLEVLRPAIPADIQIRLEKSDGDVQAMASPEQIRQVLINLIQNSIKALEAKRLSGEALSIRVRVDAADRRGRGEARIVVEDTGPGIKREHLDKLFIPFFTTSPSGTGLGLSISQKIIEAHRGRIEVATEEGRFTRVAVVLPSAVTSEA